MFGIDISHTEVKTGFSPANLELDQGQWSGTFISSFLFRELCEYVDSLRIQILRTWYRLRFCVTLSSWRKYQIFASLLLFNDGESRFNKARELQVVSVTMGKISSVYARLKYCAVLAWLQVSFCRFLVPLRIARRASWPLSAALHK